MPLLPELQQLLLGLLSVQQQQKAEQEQEVEEEEEEVTATWHPLSQLHSPRERRIWASLMTNSVTTIGNPPFLPFFPSFLFPFFLVLSFEHSNTPTLVRKSILRPPSPPNGS
ncbi:hypothetical protein BCV70DRAFT_200560 [Testicularia cyperi]|uniref:Uncharacterized protein n=1 Tax=Testicularia cyperi TaxID=1882483 RepID=A0A317XMT3_9BASI|nr:hypothetical protein BCV70DRAFT_200560 [Testicularia cyperi]